MKSIHFKILSGTALLFCCLFFHLTGFSQTFQSAKDNQKVRMVIHLLGYVASDYPGAVKNGEIISKPEFAEMTEFSNTALKTAEQLFPGEADQHPEVIKGIQQLQLNIQQKKDHTLIATLSDSIKQHIIDITGFQVSPSQWPSLARGKSIYNLSCSSCHGINGAGNGKLAANLDPTPADFTDDSLMGSISPFQAYNTIRLGVTGTSMPSFPKLSEQETWDVSFYIETLKYNIADKNKKALAHLFDKTKAHVTLAEAATYSDHKLVGKLSGNKEEARQELLSIRFHSEDGGSHSLDLAKQAVHASLAFYQKGDFAKAKQKALAAYLDGIEPIEAQLRNKNASFTAKLEQQMLGLRSVIDKRKPVEKVTKEVNTSLAMISSANNMLKNGKLTFWLAFLLSGSILLREGLEAFLIIAVILALIGKTGKKKALWWVHGGWLIAIVLGFAGWFLSGWVLNIGGRNRELMEGLVTLFAVCVLISAGLWLHNKSHAKHWKKFVEEKIGKLVQTENMIGLGLFSFMVVFREAFESILFLQAVRLETPSNEQSAIGLGVLAALVAIAILVVLFLKFSGKIPIRLLFRYSSWMIVVLAVILIGDGIHAIQEAGFFPVTPIPLNIQLNWIGLYPTMETLIPQVILIVFVASIWYFSKIRLARTL